LNANNHQKNNRTEIVNFTATMIKLVALQVFSPRSLCLFAFLTYYRRFPV